MIRGLIKSWKQLVYYDFDQVMNKNSLSETINQLEHVGVRVTACVNELGRRNLLLWKDLQVTEGKNSDHPRGRPFNFGDTPHLLKLIRNLKLDEGLSNENMKLSKSRFSDRLDRDSGELKLCPKLKLFHVEVKGSQRMKVRHTAQLLSNTSPTALYYIHPSMKEESHLIRAINSYFAVRTPCLSIVQPLFGLDTNRALKASLRR